MSAEEAVKGPGHDNRKRSWIRYLVFLAMLPLFPYMLIWAGPATFFSFNPAPSLILAAGLIALAILVGIAEGKRQLFEAGEVGVSRENTRQSEVRLDEILPDTVNR